MSDPNDRTVLCPASVVVACADLDAAIAFYEGLGLRLDMIMPADNPRVAAVSGYGVAVKLVADGADGDVPATVAQVAQQFLLARAGAAWSTGRAGMLYRDLIPGRVGGRVIASQIRIPEGGPVADYVHYHRVGFQMIYCRRGWARVVYEDQGPAFVMREGDCVLQPPGIRHRVLESGSGLEVIEVSAPAEHETSRDHALDLPTAMTRPTRLFGGQLFVHHIAAEAVWRREAGFEVRDSGIAGATGGLVSVRILRAVPGAAGVNTPCGHELLFVAVLDGTLHVRSEAFGVHTLNADDACVIPTGGDYSLEAAGPCEMLEVALRAPIPATA